MNGTNVNDRSKDFCYTLLLIFYFTNYKIIHVYLLIIEMHKKYDQNNSSEKKAGWNISYSPILSQIVIDTNLKRIYIYF